MKLSNILYTFSFILFSYTGYSQSHQGAVTIKTNKEIDNVITLKKDYNKSIKTIKGFKVQLFFGEEKLAYETQIEFSNLYPEIPSKIIFSTPDWKVQAGNFINRLDADRALADIKIDFPGAIVLQTDIDITPPE